MTLRSMTRKVAKVRYLDKYDGHLWQFEENFNHLEHLHAFEEEIDVHPPPPNLLYEGLLTLPDYCQAPFPDFFAESNFVDYGEALTFFRVVDYDWYVAHARPLIDNNQPLYVYWDGPNNATFATGWYRVIHVG